MNALRINASDSKYLRTRVFPASEVPTVTAVSTLELERAEAHIVSRSFSLEEIAGHWLKNRDEKK